MDEIRMLHVADLHIDSPMLGLVAYEDTPIDTIRTATRTAFQSVIADAIEHHVDLVLIAGDLYDGSWRDYNTGLFVVGQLAQLHEAGIPVVIVLGNHDAESTLTKRLRLPPNTKVLSSDRTERYVLEDIDVAVHGRSYAEPAVTDDLTLTYPIADTGLLNIGLLHTCFDGQLGHDRYAPCTLDGLRSKGYDYWALGHVHNHTVICEDPLIVFPGNLQGRHVRETGRKGACLVTFEDRVPTFVRLEPRLVRWEHLRVDVSNATNMDDCLDLCRAELAEIVSSGSETYAVRVEFEGASFANRSLRSRPELLANEVRALATSLGSGTIWIEHTKVSTRPPRGTLSFTGDGVAGEIGHVLAELRADVSSLARSEYPKSPELANLRRQLRSSGPEMVDALSDEDLREALDDAAELLATLLGPEGQTNEN